MGHHRNHMGQLDVMTRLYLKVHMFVNEVFHGILHYTARWSEPAVFSKQGPVIPVPGAVRYTSSSGY